jgi:hypothetical protein
MKRGKKIEAALQRRKKAWQLMQTDASWRGDAFRKHGIEGFREPGSRKFRG